MNDRGTFVVKLTEADLVAAFRLHARLERVRPVVLAAVLLIMILLLIFVASPAARISATSRPLTLMLEGAVLLLLALVIPLAFAIRPLWRRAARRSLAVRLDLSEPITYEFSAETLRHTSCFSNSNYPWDGLYGWREDDHVLIVYPSLQLFYVIPKAQLEPGVLAAFRAAIEAAGLAKR